MNTPLPSTAAPEVHHSTAPALSAIPAPTRPGPTQPEIKICSHSPILYWWPVWVVGFIMALVTLIDGGRMAYAPPGTVLEGNRLVAPQGTTIEEPSDRVAHNPGLGTIFFLTLIIVFVASNVQLRGLWEWIAILGIALAVAIFSLYGVWHRLYDWFNWLHIHIKWRATSFCRCGSW